MATRGGWVQEKQPHYSGLLISLRPLYVAGSEGGALQVYTTNRLSMVLSTATQAPSTESAAIKYLCCWPLRKIKFCFCLLCYSTFLSYYRTSKYLYENCAAKHHCHCTLLLNPSAEG